MDTKSPRTCIYTGKEAVSKDHPLPKSAEVIHNWANRAPVNPEYQKTKQGRMPTELEMEANRLFYLLELARMDVVFLTEKLKEVQDAINNQKKEEVDKAYHMKELTESFESEVQEVLKDSTTKVWD